MMKFNELARHHVTVLGAVTLDGETLTPRQRKLISALVLQRHAPASLELLIELVWVDPPPRSARQSLQNQISRLRAQFGADVIITMPLGYRLSATSDVHTLTSACTRACAASTSTHHPSGDAMARLGEALAEWHGDPYLVLDHPLAQLQRNSLIELRSSATELLAHAHIAMGTPHMAARSLDVLTKSHPFRESAWALLMIALYRDGRRIEALQAFDRLSGFLDDELGTCPSAAIAHLRSDIHLGNLVDAGALRRPRLGELSLSA